MECLRLTKDIRDELKMVEHVLRSQMKAVSDYLAYVIPPEDVVERESNTGNVKRTKVPNNGPIISNEVDDLYDKLKESLELRLIKLVTLQKDAAMVEESVRDYSSLSMNQKCRLMELAKSSSWTQAAAGQFERSQRHEKACR
jgi:hypothetical protein